MEHKHKCVECHKSWLCVKASSSRYMGCHVEKRGLCSACFELVSLQVRDPKPLVLGQHGVPTPFLGVRF